MKEKFETVARILERLWPELQKMDWSQYGDKLSSVDDLGQPKYPSLLFLSSSLGGFFHCSQTFGDPADAKVAKATADRKIVLTFSYHSTMTSMERRDTAVGDYGGGIKTSIDPFKACALTGQPEIVDHVLLACTMHVPRLLTLNHFKRVTDQLSLKGLALAMQEKGMTEAQYLQLVRDINNLVERFVHA